MDGYRKRHYKIILLTAFICAAYNLYFLFLLPEVKTSYLLYLDFLVFLVLAFVFGADFWKDKKRRSRKQEALRRDCIVSGEFQDSEDKDITAHDIAVLERERQEQFLMNCELQDYVAQWCHEVKIPLAASLLMAEKIEDVSLKSGMREQLERMNQQLHAVLLGARIQGSLFDLQIRETNLLECVKSSVHNNQFFLIKNHFDLKTEDSLERRVYTDPSWLTYVLDQLISNAVKYSKGSPCLNIYAEGRDGEVRLYVADNGEGIREQDIRRIFEKGYTGSSYHNGQYRSTGMGLYMAAVILERLGHEIYVESVYGEGTRFTISFHSDKNVRFPFDL
ncbi:MAG: sensor histidine kinase [Blautia sp.]|nr:sensor histidine kinase [Blautia sp.]MCM1201690.1 sensor histidine kinase [Bacteroides fragilis]